MSERIHVQVHGAAQPRGGGGLGFLLIFPGLGFIAIGVLVLFVPKLLEILVAGAFIMFGLGLVLVSLWLRRAKKRMSAFEQQFTGGAKYPG